MKEYPKIETLFNRDEKTFKVKVGEWRLPEFAYLQNNEWVFTEKIDGTNVRVMWSPETGISFGGKTDNAQMPTFLLAKLQELFPIEKMRTLYPDISMCLYGEGYGTKIQKGGGNYISNGVNFILFDVLIDNWWLERENIEDIASKVGVACVPIVGKGTLNDMVKLVGGKSTFGDFLVEGVVAKPLVTLFTRRGQRLVAKLKAKDF